MSEAKREVVVVSGVRTAIGDFGGSLKDFSPTELGAMIVRETLQRAKVTCDVVGHVVFGNVVHTEPKDMYLARVAAINGGVVQHVPALTVNRLCGSGLQAVPSASPSRRRDRRRRREHESRDVRAAERAFWAAYGGWEAGRHDGWCAA
ncbi:hypothetical protein [Caballeronia novacaledonica]|uniref:Thiolase N-terminal domain-containing protein n=1 Tax=Caballeronia novacaledonica TaxID=1544861 RepID=A0AA37IGR9_9BURK|nr:hypothetical protein CBA19CS42_32745 [Caballeronia novacaledonica]